MVVAVVVLAVALTVLNLNPPGFRKRRKLPRSPELGYDRRLHRSEAPPGMLDPLIYTVVAIVLYLVSDRLLELVEVRRGRRFEQRTLVFFLILATLALASFALIRRLLGT